MRSEKSCIRCYTNIINIYARNDGEDFSLFARRSTANHCIFKSIQREEIKLFRIVLVLSLIVIFTTCSKSDDSSSNSTVIDSCMATAIPSNLSVSSNTESDSSVSIRTAGRSLASEINDDNDPKKHKDKVARLKAVLNTTNIGQSHKAIPKKMKGSGGKYVYCYGPKLDYVNHPSDNTTDGQLPG